MNRFLVLHEGAHDKQACDSFHGEDDFVAVEAFLNNQAQQRSNKVDKPFHLSQILFARFKKVHKMLESGSGPGGRSFNSTVPSLYRRTRGVRRLSVQFGTLVRSTCFLQSMANGICRRKYENSERFYLTCSAHMWFSISLLFFAS